MSLSVNLLQRELISMRNDSNGAGDTIGVAITNYLNTMFPIIAGPLKNELDTTFIDTLNLATYLNPLTNVLPAALDVYKAGLIPIISFQNTGLIATPPPITPLFIVPILLSPQTRESFAISFSTALDAWFRTGTYIIPPATVINIWS
jgi:hypothetical protein